tara:strand:- start:263 stop:478 length:216 start_codon:yes stop_codon:yes gene_type:complete
MRLSNQALGALMMALQKSLMEQSDITVMLNEFKFQVDENEQLIVLNPPTVKFDNVGSVLLDEEKVNTTGSD